MRSLRADLGPGLAVRSPLRRRVGKREGRRGEPCRVSTIFSRTIIGLALLSGCKTIDGTWGVPPFFEVYPTPSSIGSKEGTETFFRPFGSHERLGQDSHHVRFFSPFF